MVPWFNNLPHVRGRGDRVAWGVRLWPRSSRIQPPTRSLSHYLRRVVPPNHMWAMVGHSKKMHCARVVCILDDKVARRWIMLADLQFARSSVSHTPAPVTKSLNWASITSMVVVRKEHGWANQETKTLSALILLHQQMLMFTRFPRWYEWCHGRIDGFFSYWTVWWCYYATCITDPRRRYVHLLYLHPLPVWDWCLI